MVNVSMEIMEDKFSFDSMTRCSMGDLRELLLELNIYLESRISNHLDGITNPKFIKNSGAINSVYLNDKERREAYFSECESIVADLVKLGHKLQPLDLDSDINFENTSLSWVTLDHAGRACGLELEFFPKETNVQWVIEPKVFRS